MSALDQRIAEAWQAACADLGIHIKTPFTLTQKDGAAVQYIALVEHFGSEKGMLLLSDSTDSMPMNVAQANGYGYSCLSHGYENYERERFVDTLNDWGWTGPRSETPDWYTGEPWTS